MSIQFRSYTNEAGFTDDFHAVREFLVRINAKNPIQYDFEWGRWEWAFSSSSSYHDTKHLHRIGIWEHSGEIVAVATYEQGLGTAYFCIDAHYTSLKAEMLQYAKGNLCEEDGKIRILINNADQEFQKIAAQQGFKPTQDIEGNAVYDIAVNSPEYVVLPGYSIHSLAEGYDLLQFHRVLWKGFDHEGEAPTTADALEDRRRNLSGPHLNLALCVVAEAANGDYVSYCGMWYDPGTEYALVEPVATVPQHRKRGLGKAVVLEAIKRCGDLGARQAYVGSSQQFYYQLGFHPLPASTFWEIR